MNKRTFSQLFLVEVLKCWSLISDITRWFQKQAFSLLGMKNRLNWIAELMIAEERERDASSSFVTNSSHHYYCTIMHA